MGKLVNVYIRCIRLDNSGEKGKNKKNAVKIIWAYNLNLQHLELHNKIQRWKENFQQLWEEEEQ